MIKAYSNPQVNYATKGLALYTKGNFKFLVSYTWLKHGTYWSVNEHKKFKVKLKREVMTNTTNTSLSIGRFRINFVSPTK